MLLNVGKSNQQIYIIFSVYNIMSKIKKIHKIVVEICKIYHKEGVPKIISYPYWFLLLFFIVFIKGEINERTKEMY